jgi:hypothetical protein
MFGEAYPVRPPVFYGAGSTPDWNDAPLRSGHLNPLVVWAARLRLCLKS